MPLSSVPSSLRDGPTPLPTAGPQVLPETALSRCSTNTCGMKEYFLKCGSHYWIITTISVHQPGKRSQQEVYRRDFFRGIGLRDCGV